LELVRSVVPHVICGKQIWFELPNIGLLFDRVHPLYIQASALAHSAPVDPKVWQVEGLQLTAVRDHIQKVQEPLSRVCKLQIETMKDTSAIFETAQLLQDSYLAAFKDIADALHAGSACLTSVRKTAPPHTGSGRGLMWRFDAFCQSLDIIIAELSSLTLLSMKLMRISEDTEPGASIAHVLTALASVGAKELDEAELCLETGDAIPVLQKLMRRTITSEQRGGVGDWEGPLGPSLGAVQASSPSSPAFEAVGEPRFVSPPRPSTPGGIGPAHVEDDE